MSKFDPNFPERRSLGTVPEIVPAETSPVPAEAAPGVPELPAPGELAAAPEKRVPAKPAAALEAAETALVETFEVIEDEAVPGAAKALAADAVVEDAHRALEGAPARPLAEEQAAEFRFGQGAADLRRGARRAGGRARAGRRR